MQFGRKPLNPSPHRDVVGVQTPLGEQLFDVAVRQGKRKYHPTANRMTSGSNCRHLNKPQSEDARRSIQLPYHRMTAKLQHFRKTSCNRVLERFLLIE